MAVPRPVQGRSPWKGPVGAALGAVGARAAYALFARSSRQEPADGAFAEHMRDVWQRTNFRGENVTLLEGPALAAGACVGTALAPGTPRRMRAAAMIAAAGAAGFGAYDDIAGSAGTRGFRGHMGALARGEVTTGAVKVAGIGAAGLAAAAVLGRHPLDTLVDGALIAGAANLFNLFDLRPGRAAKAGLITGAPGIFGPSSGIVGPLTGATAALLPEDLGERAMLGDAGANAMGAALGTAAAASLSRPARIGLLGGVIGLTLAGEFVSFSRVIARTPPLRLLDGLGRRPAPDPDPAAADAPRPARPACAPAFPRQSAPSAGTG
ncbi:MAG: hypothetical protein M0026_05700 [Nocardiopsaceae bacterium]|nr:hypothetical protein [Nocardiopsaceae bacterium]